MQPKDACEGGKEVQVLEESLEDLYENAPCGYLSTTPDGLIVRINTTLLRWLGYASDELTSRRRFFELMPVGYRVFYESHFIPLLHLQGAIKEFAFELVRTDGQRVPVLLNAVQKRDARGEPLVIRTTVYDVTDRKSYERELLLAKAASERAAKERSDFAAMLSHEIRSPLSAMMGLVDALKATPLSERQQRYITLLDSASESLRALVEDVLVYSKIEAGKVALVEQPLKVAQLTAQIGEQLRMSAEAKGLELRIHVDSIVPEFVLGDPIKIGQILRNLLGNAIKFTSHGSVTVAVSVVEQRLDEVMLDFRVTDTGIGIAHDRLLLIFREFEQETPEISSKYGGTGLGLAISKRLVELYGGRIFVESNQGEGSTFAFTLALGLPLSRKQPSADASTSV